MNAQRYIGMRASLSGRNLLPGKFIGRAVKLNSSRSFTFPVWEPFWHREMNYLVGESWRNQCPRFQQAQHHSFLGSQGKGRDPRARREVRFRNILNLACHTDQSRTLWLMWSRRKLRPRKVPVRRTHSFTQRPFRK